MTTEELIAEITSGGFAQYEDAGLIDESSLRLWIKNELKRFGANIMPKNENIVHIENYKGKLPYNFWQLDFAVTCKIKGYTCEDSEDILQNSFFFKERVEGLKAWNNESNTFEDKEFRYVREEFYLHKSKAEFYYGDFQPLKLTKGFNRKLCSTDCNNIRETISGNSKNEINIVGDYLNTNFKKGTIYMQYKGLSMDDNNNLIIPETQHNRIKEYLMYYCRMRILEEIVTGKDDDAVNLLSYYNTKQERALSLALTESKMEGLGRNWARDMRNKARLQSLKYEMLLPTR